MRIYIFIAAILSLHAQPSGMMVEAGKAVLSAEGNTLNIQTSDRAILNWDSFSIGKNEATRFISDSTVLNRVVGSDMSELLGQLHAKGKIYLINPNGVLIGKDAIIHTQGFFASTLDVLNEEFLSGEALHFLGDAASKIENFGRIECASGPVCLLARQVENKGEIEADAITLGGGFEFLVQPEGTSTLFIRPNSDAKMINEGTLKGLVVDLQSDGHNALAINNKGIIQASKLSSSNGRVFLKAPQGTAEVCGKILAPQGEVQVLAKAVHLTSQAEIDVSHEEGAGSILVGGDFQGKNPEIQNANITWAGPDTSLKADGGDGKVILWSDQATFHYGSISAKGGSVKKNGGFVEISGLHLEPNGIVDTSAPFGKMGTLLLDPTDVVIGSDVTTGSFSGCGSPPSTYQFVTGTQPNQINATTLNTQLASCNVVIDTVGSGGSGPNQGSITVSTAISWTSGSSLTLNANGAVAINADISAGNGDFTCSSTLGDITINSGSPFLGLNFSTINGRVLFSSPNNFQIESNINCSTTGTGDFRFTATNDMVITGTINSFYTGNANLSFTSGDNMVLGDYAHIGVANLSFTAGGDFIIPITVLISSSTGNISVSAGYDVALYSIFQLTTNSAATATVRAANNVLVEDNLGITSGVTATISSGNDISVARGVFVTDGNLTFLAGNSLVGAGSALFFGTSNAVLKIVVDNNNPSSVGSGVLTFPSNGLISCPTLSFYLALPGVNSLPATINSVPLGSGNVSCGVFYPSGSFVAPFSVFYKSCRDFLLGLVGQELSEAFASILLQDKAQDEDLEPQAKKTVAPCQVR